MNARQKLHQVQLQEWAARFSDQKASGLTVRQWCDLNNLSFHKFNYWKHILKEELTDQLLPDIAPLCVPQHSFPSGIAAAPGSSEIYTANRTNCANRAISANHTGFLNASSGTVSFTANGISFEIDPSIPDAFLCSLMKAVRHA